MKLSDRAIKIAKDKISGEILEADIAFATQSEGFDLREKYHSGELDLLCCECNQGLYISTSIYNRQYFKHFPNHEPCILTDNDFTPLELKSFTDALVARESPRHKELKNKIGNRLKLVEGVELVHIDDHFIIRGEEKRRPDVYCKYKDKELVFEIQLSDLTPRYILSRYNFYRKHGMYLIWILDNFDVHAQTPMVRDLKWISSYHNIFRLDETVEEFKLACEYKVPFIASDDTVHTKWDKKSVFLHQIAYDAGNVQAYYFDLPGKTKEKEAELERHLAAIAEAERQRLESARLNAAREKANSIVNAIAEIRKSKVQDFYYIREELDELTAFEITALTQRLNLDNSRRNNLPAVHSWIHEAKKEDNIFLNFVLNTEQIQFDANLISPEGTTLFQEIHNNPNVHSNTFTKALFKRGYSLKPQDYPIISSLEDGKNLKVFYTLCSQLNDRSSIEFMFSNQRLIYTIESARRGEIIGFGYKPDQWLAFANNAIEYKSVYWEYIELAFKHFGLWDKLIELDKKGTFQGKLEKFYKNMPEQIYDFEPVFNELYPEIRAAESN